MVVGVVNTALLSNSVWAIGRTAGCHGRVRGARPDFDVARDRRGPNHLHRSIGKGDVKCGDVVVFVPGPADATVIHDHTRLFALRTMTCGAGIAAWRFPAPRALGL